MTAAETGAWLTISGTALIAAWVAYDTIRDRCRIDADPVRYLARLAWYRERRES